MNPSDVLKGQSKMANQTFEEISRSKEMKELAQQMAKQIKKRTRLGYGANEGKQARLKGLDRSSTVKQRGRYKGNLSSETSTRKSNLTATGALLDAIEGSMQSKRLVIEVKNKTRKTLNGSFSQVSNKQVAGFVQEMRPFFDLTNSELKLLERELFKLINDFIEKGK
jgi:hypothetical protein